ncbi:chromosomal replication initiator protein DnaA [Sphingopyxis sp. 113P3]|jgi:chromosomal replication initiator protein DnaA|uniref:chromosomal replication initiator protein DnaA n=1 Tax=Sphingopyxis sp. (strain 113P3) TaxID=292913 RepID=UPI0006AD4188|nr:chromosomal replication initiator protein DnaA [Sphingopyxis sp. 113P3]ALC10332.1 chromosomal replication initiator protein DnaA [Sphingopyxis sp. 113P3]
MSGDAATLWPRVAEGLRRDLGVRTFDHWLKPVRFADYCSLSGVVTLETPSRFSANWINERFGDRLELAWRHHLPAVRSVLVRAGAASSERSVAAMTPAPSLPGLQPPSAMTPAAASPFDARLSFDRFVVARSNILAANAARRMAMAEVPQFNPLYLCSGTGQGKTHLLHAIAQSYAAIDPAATIILMSAEKFMLEFVGAMRGGDMMAFKTRLRAADLLLLDDLQFVIGKNSTQEELLHTIDDLMTAGKRLVVTADRPPAMLDGVEARLLSRLSGGLVADIEAPEDDLRERIIRQRLAAMPMVEVPDDVVAYLVKHFTRNIRELEGALNKLLAYAALTGARVDLTLAEDRLAENVRSARPRITIDEIQRAVCAHYRLDKAEMASKRRVRAVARPRQVAMYLAKELTPRSYPEIGRRFGGRDHSTVIHAVRTVEALRVTDSELDAEIAAIRRSLNS